MSKRCLVCRAGLWVGAGGGVGTLLGPERTGRAPPGGGVGCVVLVVLAAAAGGLIPRPGAPVVGVVGVGGVLVVCGCSLRSA